MRFSVECAFPHLRKRGVASRKSAVCARALTERCTLCPGPHGKVHSGKSAGCRMRFSVRVWSQNALFRRVRFFSPAQTWRRLTERRTLCPGPHGKAHFGKDERRRARRRCARRRRARRHEQLTAGPEATSLPSLSAHAKVTRSAQPCTRPRLSVRDPSAQALRGCA